MLEADSKNFFGSLDHEWEWETRQQRCLRDIMVGAELLASRRTSRAKKLFVDADSTDSPGRLCPLPGCLSLMSRRCLSCLAVLVRTRLSHVQILVRIDAADDVTLSFFDNRHSLPPALMCLSGFAGTEAWTGQSRDQEVRPFSGHRHRRGKAPPQGVSGRPTGPGKDMAGRSECGSGHTGTPYGRQPTSRSIGV
jgi:hypothetical protein